MKVRELVKLAAELPEDAEVLVHRPGKDHHYLADAYTTVWQACYFPGEEPSEDAPAECLVLVAAG